MAQTPLSTNTPYITAAQLFFYCDYRTLADYLGDQGQRLGGTQPDPAVVAASPALAELLLAASGEIESVALSSGMYTPTDLQALTGAGAAKLREICAGLTLRRVFRRRPQKEPKELEIVKDAEAFLEALAAGTKIFGTQEAANAGLPEHEVESQQDHRNQRLTTGIARAFFGRRQKDYRQNTI